MSIKKNGVDEKVRVVCRVRPFLEHEAPDDSVVVEENEIKITNQRNVTEIVSFRQVPTFSLWNEQAYGVNNMKKLDFLHAMDQIQNSMKYTSKTFSL